LTSPHDALFRYTFGQPEHAAPLLRSLLPAPLAAAIDWRTLALRSGAYVDKRLRQQFSDLLFTVRLAGRLALLWVVFDHKSRNDPWAVLQLLGYELGIWKQLLRQNPRPAKLPPILPVVVHHGPDGWTAATQLAELIDLDGLPPDVAPTLALMQFVARRRAADAAAAFVRWAELARAVLAAPSGQEAIAAISSYLLHTTPLDERELGELFERHVEPRTRTIMRTGASKLRAEGRVEGRVELLVGQLTKRFGTVPDDVRARLQSASAAELDRWAIRLLDARSLDELFAD
jgi:predicted transposase YdaD